MVLKLRSNELAAALTSHDEGVYESMNCGSWAISRRSVCSDVKERISGKGKG